ncbi:GEVED domain-containing protein [uncultured Nonlabens sp.]|uniref:GEVED domain-containing protein n=1 Tax=uncultured Nonlabens sp. TaxID=859306 RepID=UPI002611A308|nr:GEVED domain-containing protein [uncultured Nonlabens sp.]
MKNITQCMFVSFVALFCFSTVAQTQKERDVITSRMDLPALKTLEQRFKAHFQQEKREALDYARANNLLVRKTLKDGTLLEIQRIERGTPIYYSTSNVAAAKSTRANFLHNGGGLGLNLEGQNMTGYIWDGGLARASHQEYDGPGGSNRFSIGDNSTTLNFHAAHVTGTVIAYGAQANAKGMAPKANAVGHDWNNDKAEVTAQVANGMLLSNHSYGYAARDRFGSPQLPDYFFGGYIAESRDWDEIMFNAPYYMMVKAAGNDGNDNTVNPAPLNGNSSYDKLSGTSVAKNNLVIANAQDASINGDGTLNSVAINSSSSEGPTDDLRIKPDLTGNGTNVYSTYESSDTAYNSITGTSMASPNVMGSLLLLQQHYNNLNGSYMRAATLKGLALHTADDAGPVGPDAIWGWGLMNTKKAAESITANGNGSTITELTLTSGQSYTINVNASGLEDLVASISWTDRPGTATTTANSSTARLVNDLDIRVTKSGTTYTPWRLTGVTTNGLGDNSRDPFERIEVGNASGTYTITVTNKGTLVGGSQNYSLIVTGIAAQAPVCNATTPSGLNSTGASSTDASLAWNAVTGTSYEVRFRKSGTTAWTTRTATTTSATLIGLTASTVYQAQVRSVCPDASTSGYSSTLSFSTTGVQYCAANGNSTNDEFISRVTFNTIDQASTAGTGGYTNFTSVSTTVSKGTSYNIAVTPRWTGTLYNEGYAAWIDFNQDGDFDDAGELVWSAAASQTTPATGSISIPAGASSGTTRMRVAMRYNAIPSSCGSFDYGEVEDYTVNITATAADTTAPTVPTSLVISAVTQNTATASWVASTDNVAVVSYDVYMDGSLLGTIAGTTANLTGLTASTSYVIRVRAKDEAGNNSAQSTAVSFTTQAVPSSGCTNAVAIPYTEGFESGLGAWSQGTGDDFDWTRRSGGTPSNNTGPSSASAGNFYMYLEASAPNNTSKTTYLDSPCFDLSGTTEASFSFKYHMYGSRLMGGLTLQASTNNGISWTSLWSESGNQGNSWQEAAVDISTYVGGSVKFRFVGTTTNQWQGDIAIDAINLVSTEVANNAYSNATVVTSSNITIYPNPVKEGLLFISSNQKEMEYAIYNLQGQTVIKGNTDKEVDVDVLKSGIYLIEIKTANQTVVKRFIVE